VSSLAFGSLDVSGGSGKDQSQVECERLSFVLDPWANDRHFGVMSGHQRYDHMSIQLDLLERVLVLISLEGARYVESSSLSPGAFVVVSLLRGSRSIPSPSP
jgi:hypothetical protein